MPASTSLQKRPPIPVELFYVCSLATSRPVGVGCLYKRHQIWPAVSSHETTRAEMTMTALNSYTVRVYRATLRRQGSPSRTLRIYEMSNGIVGIHTATHVDTYKSLRVALKTLRLKEDDLVLRRGETAAMLIEQAPQILRMAFVDDDEFYASLCDWDDWNEDMGPRVDLHVLVEGLVRAMCEVGQKGSDPALDDAISNLVDAACQTDFLACIEAWLDVAVVLDSQDVQDEHDEEQEGKRIDLLLTWNAKSSGSKQPTSN